MTVQIVEALIARIVAQCAEAVPDARRTFDYLLGVDYPHYPYWCVGERDYEPAIEETESLHLTISVLARLFGGKIGKGYKGDAERELRPYTEQAVQYFANRLRLNSTAYPDQGMPYMLARGVQFARPRKAIDESPNDGVLVYVEFAWTVPFRIPRELRS